jgi:hypothetical protein
VEAAVVRQDDAAADFDARTAGQQAAAAQAR